MFPKRTPGKSWRGKCCVRSPSHLWRPRRGGGEIDSPAITGNTAIHFSSDRSRTPGQVPRSQIITASVVVGADLVPQIAMGKASKKLCSFSPYVGHPKNASIVQVGT